MRKVFWLFIALFWMLGCGAKVEKELQYSEELITRGLYAQAIEQLQYVRDNVMRSSSQKANIQFQLAEIYERRLGDYDQALAEYLRLIHLYPKSQLIEDAKRRSVFCLELMQKPGEASRLMEQVVSPDSATAMMGDTLALIAGKHPITRADYMQGLDGMEPQMREYLLQQGGEQAVLEQVIAQYLMKQAAERTGIYEDKEFTNKVASVRDNVAIQVYLQKVVGAQVKVDNQTARLYYQANQQQFARDGQLVPFEEVREQIIKQLQDQQLNDKIQEHVQKLVEESGVQIFESKLKKLENPDSTTAPIEGEE